MGITIPISKSDIAEILKQHSLPVNAKTINAVRRQMRSIASAWAFAWLQDATRGDLQDAVDTFGDMPREGE